MGIVETWAAQNKQFIPNNLLKEIAKKPKQSKKKKKRINPSDIELPPTPKLPIAKVKLSWMTEPIKMRVLMFYHSRPHIFGCQFSNLFYCPIQANTKWIIPTRDKTLQTLMNYERENIKNENDEKSEENMETFQSTESIFQSAKAKNKIDAIFVQSLSPGDAARAGQARLKMSNGLATKYKKIGGEPFKIKNNHWQFAQNNKRYKVRSNWHFYKIEIMNYALRIKFKSFYNLIAEYVDCDVPVYFVEHTQNDKQWADGKNGCGTNYLGKLLTALCWEYRMNKKQKNENDDHENENKEESNEFLIDTMSDEFLEWMKMDNIDLIVDGKQFYEENAECEWLK